MLPLHLEISDNASLYHLYLWKLTLCYRFQEFQPALENLARLEDYIALGAGGFIGPPAYFYSSLAKLAVFSEASEFEQEGILEKVRANQDSMQVWAQYAPMNYLHKSYLVEAEKARVLGNDNEAREYYEKAIDLAQEHGYLNEESLAYELTARFYLAKEQTRLARYYMRDAHYAYQRWGAMAKVKDLEERYPQLLVQMRTIPTGFTTTSATTITGRSTSTLDLASVIKASQAISGEIVLEKLLGKLMQTVIENAGAQKGFLILEKGGELVIEAEGAIGKDDVSVLQSIPVQATQVLPTAIIYYVERTREKVVLDDATQEEMFATDAYITQNQPKSILCAPLINQARLTGILYLENNLTTGAFTPERLEVLNLLSAQAAISIENARLYDNMDGLVKEQTTQLEQAKEELEQVNAELEAKNKVAMQELQDARDMQMSLLPQSPPTIEGFDIDGFSYPAREVGGDFFDYLSPKDGKIGIALADVSGKGLKAAMNAVLANGMLHEVAKIEASCGKILSALNADLYPRMERLMFTSLGLAILGRNNITLQWANAGQPYPIVKRGEQIFEFKRDGELPLGMIRKVEYQDWELELQAGDIVIFYTDGIIEAENKAEKMYGTERLEQVIMQINPTMNAQQIIKNIWQDVSDFVGSTEQYDDMTVVVVKKL